MRKESLVKNLPLLVGDVRGRLQGLHAAAAGAVDTFDPFDDIYRIIYRLAMRNFGANDIIDPSELLDESLALFVPIEASTSPTRIIFPWLPTLAHFRRMAAGARLHMMFDKIVQERKVNGIRGDDTLQYLLDNGVSEARAISVSC